MSDVNGAGASENRATGDGEVRPTGGGPQWMRNGNGGLGTASFFLGILAVFGYCIGPIAGVLAIIFGVITLVQARTRSISTRGLAVWGISMGAVGAVFWGILTAMLYLRG